MNKSILALITATSLSLFSTITLAQSGSELPYTVLKTIPLANSQTIAINHGGFGSDAARHPSNPNQFYAITDRGPNLDFVGEHGKGKIFAMPEFTPNIGLFEIAQDKTIKQIKTIPLKKPDGTLITGLPNPAGLGATNELPYNLDGEIIRQDPSKPYNKETNPIKLDDYGLDSEGIVALKDGSFWISDEYGPHIVHFDKNGVEIGRINPFKADQRTQFNLPAEFANRRANRGMEGLAITPDESTLVGIMQSSLDNPDKAARKTDLTRIVTVNLKNGKIQQFIYPQDKKENSNSGITALNNHEFLLIERDGKYPLKDASAIKRIYKIDLNSGTNLEEITLSGKLTRDTRLGHLIEGKTLEQYRLNHDWNDFAKLGVKPVQKELVSDLVKEFNYPHEKLEGLWLIDANTLAVINDDDFSINSKDNKPEVKYLDKDKKIIDHSTVHLFELIK